MTGSPEVQVCRCSCRKGRYHEHCVVMGDVEGEENGVCVCHERVKAPVYIELHSTKLLVQAYPPVFQLKWKGVLEAGVPP